MFFSRDSTRGAGRATRGGPPAEETRRLFVCRSGSAILLCRPSSTEEACVTGLSWEVELREELLGVGDLTWSEVEEVCI
jgi:hypothetical protein